MEPTDYLERLSPYQQGILDSDGNLVGIRNRKAQGNDLYGVRLTAAGNLLAPDSRVLALSSVWPVVNLTATGSLAGAACEFGGFTVRSLTGSVTVAVYDALSATGTAIMTATFTDVGTYYWDGDWATPGVGNGNARSNTTGGWAVITGTANIDFLVR